MRSLVVSFLFVGLFSVMGHASVPTVLPVQGYLSDAQGTPLTSDVSFVFTLYEDPVTSVPLWTEHQTLAIASGHFTAYLGASKPLALALVADHHGLWLSISVNNDPPMDRVQLGTAPYAAYAEFCGQAPEHTHSSETLSGVALSGQKCQVGEVVTGFDNTGKAICEPMVSGNGGDGKTYTGADFALSGQSCPAGQMMTGISGSGLIICAPVPQNDGGGGQGGFSGTGQAKKIALFSSPDTLTSSIVTQYNNKIGINESFPSRTVEIKGDLEVTGDFYWGGNSFSTSSCLVVGGTSCSSACSKHKMSCYKAFRVDGESNGTSCGQSGFKFCCCRN
jgi:hypothetical protein